MQKNTYVAFTDGSSLGNPGPGGWGSVVVIEDTVVELGGGEKKTTNNRMELTAVIETLRYIGETEKNIIIHTDSNYVINGITKWVHGWKKNGWQTAQKGEVLNRKLWEELLKESEGKNIAWNYVAGHAGIIGNERADRIAVAFAENKAPALFKGNRETYPVKNILDLSKSADNKKGNKKQSRSGKAYSYVSMVNGEVFIHDTWAECEARVKGKRAKFKKALSADDERAIIDEWKGT